MQFMGERKFKLLRQHLNFAYKTDLSRFPLRRIHSEALILQANIFDKKFYTFVKKLTLCSKS